MALFTDGPMSSIDDLQGYDTQLPDVANTEGIDVTRKLSQAQEEIGIELGALLGSVSSARRLANVVVTPALRLWHTFRSLELVYRDAYNSQLNDRYAGKRNEYHGLVEWARERLVQSGVGMTADPIPQALAPTVQRAPGALRDGIYYVGMSWTNAACEEGAVSAPVTFAVAGSSFEVGHGEVPANARGWHVYVGSSPSSMTRQSAAALALGAAWRQPDTLSAGKKAGAGQAVGFVQGLERVLLRG